jgi:hypothetical protein
VGKGSFRNTGTSYFDYVEFLNSVPEELFANCPNLRLGSGTIGTFWEKP